MRKIPFLRALALIGLFGTVLAHAATLPYQGLATDAKSNPKSDAAYDVGFSLYASATGGDALWSESQSVSTKKGLFSTTLGAVKEIPDSLFDGAALYLGVSFDGGTEGGRVKLASTPWANRAGVASKAAFADSAAKVAGLSDSVSSLRASLAVQAGDINGLSGAVKKLTGDLGAKDSVGKAHLADSAKVVVGLSDSVFALRAALVAKDSVGKSHLADSAKVVVGLSDSVSALRAALVAKDSVGKARHADTAKVALHLIGADSLALKTTRDSVALLTVRVKADSVGLKIARDSIQNLNASIVQLQKLTGAFKYDTTWNPTAAFGSLLDARDGQVYRTVTIGSQTWMAQNLNYKSDSSWWDANSADSGAKYGRYYRWAQALGLNDSCNTKSCASQISAKQRGVCPAGWHVPADAEWATLNSAKSAASLKATYSYSSSNGTDSLGFRAIAAGSIKIGAAAATQKGGGALFWTSTELNASNAWYLCYNNSANFFRNNWSKPAEAFSVRCLKD